MKGPNFLLMPLMLAAMACTAPEETYEVRQQELNEAVYASGQVMPEPYYFLAANASERILSLLVEEGDTVEAGMVVAVLGNPSENRQLDLLTQQVSLARQQAGSGSAVMGELRTRARLAQEKYRQDSLNAVRYGELAADRAVSGRDAEQARLQASSSRAEYTGLQQQLASRARDLSSKALQAEQQLAQFNQSREGKVLASPIRGRVFQLYHQEGNLVQPGQPVAFVGNTTKYKLELLVDERDIAKIAVGQRIYFRTEVYPQQQLEARVSKIIPVLQPESRSFEVEAEVVSGEVLYPQSTVEANILIREKVPALVIPADYVLAGDSVLVRQEGKSRKVAIAPGTRTGHLLEVRRGLQAGDVLLKPE